MKLIKQFESFTGKIVLQKEEVIELVSLITDLKPQIPSEVDTANISKLIDNVNQYISECGNYKISVYFRESDVYHNSDGSVTSGQFKSLFKITIKKDTDLKIFELKDYIKLTSDIIKEVYPDSKLAVKFDKDKIQIEDFILMDDNLTIDKLVLIIRII